MIHRVYLHFLGLANINLYSDSLNHNYQQAMAFTNRIAALAASIFFMNYIGLVLSLDMAYCASINTASTSSSEYTK